MINKKIKKEIEKELIDSLDPSYSTYMYFRAKEWANIDGIDYMSEMEFDSDEWEDELMKEWEWDTDIPQEHDGNFKINEID